MEEEVIQLKRERDLLKKNLEKAGKQAEKDKQKLVEQKNKFAESLTTLCTSLEACLDVGTSNLIDFQETFLILRLFFCLLIFSKRKSIDLEKKMQLNKTLLNEASKKFVINLEKFSDNVDQTFKFTQAKLKKFENLQGMLKNIQNLGNRHLFDLQYSDKWDDFSIEMLMKDEKSIRSINIVSPPPEEINMYMPNISDLKVSDSHKLNESSQFNLDELYSNKKINTKSVNMSLSNLTINV